MTEPFPLEANPPETDNGFDEEFEDYIEMEAIPAETVSAHVQYGEDGTVEITYFAHADVWGVPIYVQPQALRNQVVGRLSFKERDPKLIEHIAREIAGSILPYRLSPNTRIGAHLFPTNRSLLDRIKLRLFGGPAFIENDQWTAELKAALCALARAAPPEGETIML